MSNDRIPRGSEQTGSVLILVSVQVATNYRRHACHILNY